jgi:hypothetical protein
MGTGWVRPHSRGGTSSGSHPYGRMGIAYYSQKRPQQALSWFARARKHEETREEAQTWLKYIQRELQSG